MSKKQPENERQQAHRQSRRFADRAHNELMKIKDRQVSRDETFTQTALGFLNAEADTGLTLARLAKDRTDEDAKARNRRHAREAYNSVVKYHHTAAHANDEALQALDQKIEKLREMLESLGEHL